MPRPRQQRPAGRQRRDSSSRQRRPNPGCSVERQMNGMMSAASRHFSPKMLGMSSGLAAANVGKTKVAAIAARRTVRRMIGAGSSPRASRLDIAGKPTMYSEVNASAGSWKIWFVNVQIPSEATPATTPTTMLRPSSRPSHANQLAWKLSPNRASSPKARQPCSDGAMKPMVSEAVSSVPTTARTIDPWQAPRRRPQGQR